jgi:hypothetical protein
MEQMISKSGLSQNHHNPPMKSEMLWRSRAMPMMPMRLGLDPHASGTEAINT